jgi:curved DNA-binding protein
MPVQYKDYYESRGVPRTASEAQINKAFRKLAREYHPDVAKDNKKAEGKFIKGSLLIIDTDSSW